jgi:heme A synthase
VSSGQAPSLAADRQILGVAAVAVYAQIVLGGVVRHSGAALACSGLPWCSGIAWPDAWRAQLHMAHRALGLLAFASAAAATAAMRPRAVPGAWRLVACAPAVLACVQVALGGAIVLDGAPLAIVTLHHACGAALLMSLVVCWGLTAPGRLIWRNRRDSAPVHGAARESA